MSEFEPKATSGRPACRQFRIRLAFGGGGEALVRTLRSAVVTIWFASFCATSSPAAPPPQLPIPLVDPTSPAFQTAFADEKAGALARVAKTKSNVRRRFGVGWEMHHGYYLAPPREGAAWVTPDISDPQIRALFDEAWASAPAHVGERLICDCAGAEWLFYSSKRFLVREARLTWERP